MLDPFVGSGVTLAEASCQGIPSLGLDINPIAVLITEVTLNPPPQEAFEDASRRLLDYLASVAGVLWDAENGGVVRYAVHEILVVCPSCGSCVGARAARVAARNYRCPDCETRLRFNLRTLERTRVVGVRLGDGSAREEIFQAQEEVSQNPGVSPVEGYSFEFAENRRTLAHPGMQTMDLFTPRNFALLTRAARFIESESSESVRNALELMLSATVAQCSRLIAYRGDLATGGPAWSVPGFWVPPIHLEANPTIHLKARSRKFASGFASLHKRPRQAPAKVELCDSTVALEALWAAGQRFDLIFLDPPYGDSVPYLEFSSLFNSFLRLAPDPSLDLSVSDRRGAEDGWNTYESRLGAVISQSSRLLTETGCLLLTFNNHDERAWNALIDGLHGADLWCSTLYYQVPAVISAKAQLAPAGSYVGDFVGVFRRRSPSARRKTTLRTVRAALCRAANARGGVIPATTARRVAIGAFLEENLEGALLPGVYKLLAELFESLPSGELLLHKRLRELDTEDVDLDELVARVARDLEEDGCTRWTELYEAVCEASATIGVPEPHEVVKLLEPGYVFVGKTWAPRMASTHGGRIKTLF